MKSSAFWFSATLICIGCAPQPFATVSSDNLESASEIRTADLLADKIDRVLTNGLTARALSTDRNAAWQIMHGVACYGHKLRIMTPDRGSVTALDYAFHNGQINGFELRVGNDPLPATERPGIKARLEPGSYIGQGHVDQWIAILAMADVPATDEIVIGDQSLTVQDFAQQAQFDVTNNPVDEYSWTLIALTHYFPDQPTWLAEGNLEVSWELLVEQELLQDLDQSPCGGTHRMAGIVSALHAKERLGLPDSEIWDRADKQVKRLLDEVQGSRGADGRLSSFYFSEAGRTFDIAAELASMGHLFEFVALAAPDDELVSDWVVLSAHRLCSLLEHTEAYDLDCGALYHALNGLKIYQARSFPSLDLNDHPAQ